MKIKAEIVETASSLKRKATLHVGAFRYSGVELLVSLVLLFMVTPFVEELPNGNVVEIALLTFVMVSAVMAVGGRRQSLVIALLLVTPALLARWGHHIRPDLVPFWIFLAASTAFFVFVNGQLLFFILRAPRVDANVLCAGISGYLMLGMLWVPAYMLVSQLSPAAFALSAGPGAGQPLDNFTAFYFSFMTLCTVGYGDITPVSKVARMLAVMEAITGLFYMAVLISRLVAVYSTAQPPAEEPRPPSQP